LLGNNRYFGGNSVNGLDCLIGWNIYLSTLTQILTRDDNGPFASTTTKLLNYLDNLKELDQFLDAYGITSTVKGPNEAGELISIANGVVSAWDRNKKEEFQAAIVPEFQFTSDDVSIGFEEFWNMRNSLGTDIGIHSVTNHTTAGRGSFLIVSADLHVYDRSSGEPLERAEISLKYVQRNSHWKLAEFRKNSVWKKFSRKGIPDSALIQHCNEAIKAWENKNEALFSSSVTPRVILAQNKQHFNGFPEVWEFRNSLGVEIGLHSVSNHVISVEENKVVVKADMHVFNKASGKVSKISTLEFEIVVSPSPKIDKIHETIIWMS